MTEREIPTVAAGFLVYSAFLTLAVGQAPGDPDEGGALSVDPDTAEKVVSWWARPGRSYFLQLSEDLRDWIYVPTVVEAGDGSIKEGRFASGGARTFVRIVWSDEPTGDPRAADFDADGVSNQDELQNGTDPLHRADSDSDLLPDDWELRFGLDPEDGSDPSSDADDDGLSALEEFASKSDPTRRDSDNDGLSDGYEALAGTLATPHPPRPFDPDWQTGLSVSTPEPKPFDPAP